MKRTLVLLILAGCSAPAPSHKTSSTLCDTPIVVQAQDPEWQKLAEELTKGMTVAEQQKALEGQRHYDLALAWFNKGDFDKAKVEAQIAIEKSPENIAARKLLSDVNEIISGKPAGLRTPAEQELRVAQVRIEQAQIEITNHLLHGERFLNAAMYRSALREFENAEFKIRNMPYDVKSHNDLLPKVRELSVRAKSMLRD
ncbi:MAG: hypothetical protein EHM91_03935 [Planctomycetota bacterium]|nr:MAG: hypothetical protein EHM91_03935 [Planctomycetota bacterium]